MANSSGAPVVLVVEAGRTRRSAAVATIERFSLLAIEVVGGVFNRGKPQQVEHAVGTYFLDSVGPSTPVVKRKQIAAERSESIVGR